MMRCRWILVSISILITALSGAREARANGGQTHGGGAIVCRSSEGKIARAEVLDLFEARELFGLRPIAVAEVDPSRSAVLANFRKRYVGRSVYPAYLENALTTFHPRFKLLNPGVRLELIPDAYPKVNERGCAIEQLAAFDDDSGSILLDREIMGALDPLNRLAIELHESAYWLDRKWRKATDSRFARKLVGLLLADRDDARLDPMIAAYDFGVPRAGVYGIQLDPGGCRIELQLRDDGGLRLFVPQSGVCDSKVSPIAFEATGYADFFPSGRPNEWFWTDKKPGENGYHRETIAYQPLGGGIEVSRMPFEYRGPSSPAHHRPLRTARPQIRTSRVRTGRR